MNLLPVLLAVVLSLLTSLSRAECAADAQVRLQVLGSGGPELDDGRASSGYLVWRGNKAVVMVDAGSGTALNFEKSGARLPDLQAVVFTHFHVDHSVDFPSLVKASYFTARDADLLVYGPTGNALLPAATQFVEKLLGENGAYPYLHSYLAPDGPEDYKIRVTDVPLQPGRIHRYTPAAGLQLAAVPVRHGPLPALAWRVDIDGCSLTFTGDMSNHYGTVAKLARGSDLLLANNAIPESAGGTARFLHMPPSEIGKIALEAKVERLVLSHRMRRTLGNEGETTQQIRRYYSGPLEFANDLDLFTLGVQ